MSAYGELDLMTEYRTQFPFKSRREHISKVNIPNIAYPNQHTDIEIPHGSIDDVIVTDTVEITFNLGIESSGKARNVVNKYRQGAGEEKCPHGWFKRHGHY